MRQSLHFFVSLLIASCHGADYGMNFMPYGSHSAGGYDAGDRDLATAFSHLHPSTPTNSINGFLSKGGGNNYIMDATSLSFLLGRNGQASQSPSFDPYESRAKDTIDTKALIQAQLLQELQKQALQKQQLQQQQEYFLSNAISPMFKNLQSYAVQTPTVAAIAAINPANSKPYHGNFGRPSYPNRNYHSFQNHKSFPKHNLRSTPLPKAMPNLVLLKFLDLHNFGEGELKK